MVEEISFTDGKPVCTCTPIEEPGLDESDLIFGVLHQAEPDKVESDDVEISGIIKAAAGLPADISEASHSLSLNPVIFIRPSWSLLPIRRLKQFPDW